MRYLKPVIPVTAGAVILMFYSFYNGFPLMYGDCGTHLYEAVTFHVPSDRPLAYSYFLFLSGARVTMWLSIFIQSLIMSGLIRATLKTILTDRYREVYFLLLAAILTFYSGLSVYTNVPLPDIYSSAAFLCLYLLLFAANRSLWVVAPLFVTALMYHYSHMLIFSVMSVSLLVVNRIYRLASVRRMALIFGLVLSSWVMTGFLHQASGIGFTISRSSHVFIMGKLAESGILDDYLHRYCTDTAGVFFGNRDHIVRHFDGFVWQSDGLVTQCGGWTRSRGAFNRVISDIFSRPEYWFRYGLYVVPYAGAQLIRIDSGDGMGPASTQEVVHEAMKHHYAYDLGMYLRSKQNTSMLSFEGVTTRTHIMCLISLLLLVWLYPLLRRDSVAMATFILLILLLVFNATICAALSSLTGRFQARVVWLLPLFTLAYLIKYFPVLVSGLRASWLRIK